MNIGIIGSGLIGASVAKLAIAAGHRPMISNSRGPESLAQLAHSLGCRAGTSEEAAAFGDMVLIAIPFKNRFQLPVSTLACRIVIDSSNYYPHRDGRIDELENGITTTSELMQCILTQSRLVKCFNAILARDLSLHQLPHGVHGRRAIPAAADDVEALNVVADFVDTLGYDVVKLGSLRESWRFERARPGYCLRLDAFQMEQILTANTRASWVEEGSWRL